MDLKTQRNVAVGTALAFGGLAVYKMLQSAKSATASAKKPAIRVVISGACGQIGYAM
jgi:hypothetical protein